jgi:hypothetical protein
MHTETFGLEFDRLVDFPLSLSDVSGIVGQDSPSVIFPEHDVGGVQEH